LHEFSNSLEHNAEFLVVLNKSFLQVFELVGEILLGPEHFSEPYEGSRDVDANFDRPLSAEDCPIIAFSLTAVASRRLERFEHRYIRPF